MFFARVRWIGRVLEGAGIDVGSKEGRELTSTLMDFSKYCQAKNRQGEGAKGVRYDWGVVEWALLSALLAHVEPKVTEHLVESLKLTPTDVSDLLKRIRDSAAALAEMHKPDFYAEIMAK